MCETAEEWRPVVGFEEYQVSNMGRVKNKDGSIKKPGKNDDGYLYVRLYKNGLSTTRSVNILVGEAFIPNPEPERLTEVNHKDCNRTNNILSNLEWMSRVENNQSKNKSGNIGCICETSNKSFRAALTLYKIDYYFINPNRVKVEDWLQARRVELKNNLTVTELDLQKKTCINRSKEGRGSVYPRKSGSFSAEIYFGKKKVTKTVKTREEAEKIRLKLNEFELYTDARNYINLNYPK